MLAPREIVIDFRQMRAAPLDRDIEYSVRIDRFSGDATRALLMLRGSNRGPKEVFGLELGECNVVKRKL